MEAGKSVMEVVVAADTVTLGEHSRIEILGLIQSEETRDCHTAARVVWAAEVEVVDWTGMMRMPCEIDFRKLAGIGC